MNQIISCPKCNEVINFKKCYNCKHYHQYYVNYYGDFISADRGYCTQKNMKSKKDDDCCVYWDGNRR